MESTKRAWWLSVSGSRNVAGTALAALGATLIWSTFAASHSEASLFHWRDHRGCDSCDGRPACVDGNNLTGEPGGTWYWMRSPEQERVAVIGLYNRYCIRCHGVDGRGVWDIPGVPDFTDVRWQGSRSDNQIARIILEGRGAVMPPFRGSLTLEESCAMARYLRTLVPGTETPKPVTRAPAKPVPAMLPKQAPK